MELPNHTHTDKDQDTPTDKDQDEGSQKMEIGGAYIHTHTIHIMYNAS